MKTYIIKYCIFNSKIEQIWMDAYPTRKAAMAEASSMKMAGCHHIKIIKLNLKAGE